MEEEVEAQKLVVVEYEQWKALVKARQEEVSNE